MDTHKHVVTQRTYYFGYLLMSVFQSCEITYCLVESTLTGTLYFILHVILFMKCDYAVGRDDKKVWCGLMSAFWKVKINSALRFPQIAACSHSLCEFFLMFYVSCFDVRENWKSGVYFHVPEQESQLVASYEWTPKAIWYVEVTCYIADREKSSPGREKPYIQWTSFYHSPSFYGSK